MYSLGEPMTIQEQPNRWSCVPTAFAIAIGHEVATLIEAIGHDGSEIIYPDLPEPLCRRAFHLQELAVVLWNLGFFVGHLDVEPHAILDENHVTTLTWPNSEQMFQTIMSDSIGVGCGRIVGTDKTHAFAWNGERCYDPLGFIYPITKFELYTFCPIKERF